MARLTGCGSRGGKGQTNERWQTVWLDKHSCQRQSHVTVGQAYKKRWEVDSRTNLQLYRRGHARLKNVL